STCHRYRAMEHSSSSRTGLDVTGIGTHACARHGCFAPGSAVDFQKGERQMNMDWSLLEALKSTGMEKLPEVLHVYDINCQYHVHLKKRIEENPHLELDDKVQLIKAIGLFHVHAHQESCLGRTASLAHRTELLDDHMGDSNYKKLVNIGKSSQR
ncbi:hypothetical protein CPB83DRAFT_777208, partial [Crepidotus variabilis]